MRPKVEQRSRPGGWVALPLIGSVLLAACGTRVDHAQVAAGVGGGTVTLSAESIKALVAARAGSRPAAPTASVVPAPVGRLSAAGPTAAGPTVAAAAAPVAATDRRAATPAGRAVAVTQVRSPNAGTKPVATGPAAATSQVPVSGTCPAALDPVAVGQVGAFSGVAGSIIGSMRPMLAAWASDLNSRGGLACHPVTVYSEDDGGDPGRSAYLAQDMATRHHVVAFIAPAVLSPNGFIPAVEAAKVPIIGGPGSDEFRRSQWMFPESASGDDQIFGLIANGVSHGKTHLGVLYCVEASVCTEAADKIKSIAKTAGAEEVYSAPVSITQPDYTAQCLNARNAGVDQLALGVDGASIGRVARSCEAIGYRPLFSTVAALLNPAQAGDPLVRSFGIATDTGEAPWTLDDTPGLREYHRVLARWAPGTPPDGASIIAFTAAKLFEAAIANVATEAAHGPITPALVLRGLDGIHDESLGGLTVGITFHPGQKGATSSGCVFYEFLTTTGWTTPNGSRPICRAAGHAVPQ
jgi:branched-chain amino acid transport system substrate-binding protein